MRLSRVVLRRDAHISDEDMFLGAHGRVISDLNNASQRFLHYGMENTPNTGDHWDDLKCNYAQNLADCVDLPNWANTSFNPGELAVLGAVRDTAYYAPNGACSLTVSEIAQLAQVNLRTAMRAITIAIGAGVIERHGNSLINRHVQRKVGYAPDEATPLIGDQC